MKKDVKYVEKALNQVLAAQEIKKAKQELEQIDEIYNLLDKLQTSEEKDIVESALSDLYIRTRERVNDLVDEFIETMDY